MPEGRTRGQTTAQTSDAGGVAQQSTSARLSYPSTLSVRRRRRRFQSSLLVHGFPLALLGYHPRLRMVRLRRRRYSVWMWMRALFCAAAAEPKAGVAILCLFLLIPILL